MLPIRALVLVLCAVACAAYAADKTVVNAQLGFEITYPAGWDVVEKPDGNTSTSGQSPRVAGNVSRCKVYFTVLDAKPGLTLKDFADSQLSQLAKRFKNPQVSESAVCEIPSGQAHRLVFTCDAGIGPVQNKYTIYYLVSKNRGCIFLSLAISDEFAQHAQAVESIVKSIKFK
jgi:hypothetical protein